MEASDELVVLVDEDGRAIGTHPKASVHGPDTPLHRAFSCYLFDVAGRLLVTRRAITKATFPGLWTNSVCGHPGPGEADVDAVRRRAARELGMSVYDVRPALPHFRYRASFAGVVENEICPVYLARTADLPAPRDDEVADHAWLSWDEVRAGMAADPGRFSHWSLRQVSELSQTRELPAYATLSP